VISWTNEEHHHAMPSEPGPGDHDMSLDLAEVCPRNCEKATTTVKIEPEGEPPLQVQAINISLSLLKLVDKYRGDKTYDQFVRTLLANFYVDTIEASPGRSIKTNEIQVLSTTARCPSCEGDILKARQREFGKCIICGAIYRLNQDNEDELIVTIKTLKCPNCDCEGSILLLKTREGDKASKYGKCYKCGFTYRLDQRGNFYHG
jgi:DNA-directed RNA polymerase subunit M/transcription elongation factor TFIIS